MTGVIRTKGKELTLYIEGNDRFSYDVDDFVITKTKLQPTGWTEWSSWSKCSVTCGGGVQKRTRKWINSPEGFGIMVDHEVDEAPCNSKKCPVAVFVAGTRNVGYPTKMFTLWRH